MKAKTKLKAKFEKLVKIKQNVSKTNLKEKIKEKETQTWFKIILWIVIRT